MPASLADWLPAPPGVLVGVVSRWPGFLKLARTMMLAAATTAESLLFRDARKPNWRRSLRSRLQRSSLDAATASSLPHTLRVVTFPLVSKPTSANCVRYEQFIHKPRQSLTA